MKEYISVIKNYTTFSGRATRREYWMFSLVSILVSMSLALLDIGLGISGDRDRSLLSDLYTALIFLPSIAVQIRRAHDTSRSGWVILIPFYSLYVMLLKSAPEKNSYGPPVHHH